MERLNGYKVRLLLIGVVAATSLGVGSAKADFTFGEPVNLGPKVNSGNSEWCPAISSDGLELYFGSSRTIPGLDLWNLWVVKRATQNDEWGEPMPLGSDINSASEEGFPQLSRDDLELYFYSKRPGVAGITDILVARRPTTSDPWGPATNLGAPMNTSQNELGAAITADGLELFFSRTSSSPAGLDIWTTRRATRDDPWGEPVKLGPTINSSASEICYSVSQDGLALFFSSHGSGAFRAGGSGGPDIWVTTRSTRESPWNTPISLSGNTAYAENSPSISSDGRWLYFDDWGSHRPGGYGSDDLWKAPLVPIVDFNGDGIVDIDDLVILIDNWGTSETLCDIGPMPWGNGIVDEADLEVLMSYWGQEAYDPALIAYWKLDEKEGNVAFDSAGTNNAAALGDPVWLPDGGQVKGALQFDGVDDYVSTDPVLNSADGVFSVVAWIQGGVPGQIVLSQAGRANWLCTDSSEGCLMTELEGSGRPSSGPLLSEAKITDGTWHRIGLVWDGSYRHLYVDGAEVAKDAAPLSSLEDAYGGLYFGTGSTLAPGTFFSGLIDDIRVYNRAVRP